MRALLDTNILVRHLTHDPPAMAARATAFLAADHLLVLTDVVLAELVYVLESVYRESRPRIAAMARVVIAEPSIEADERLLGRALDVYEYDRLDFAEAYLVAQAEESGVAAVASFDRSIDRVSSVERLEP